MTSYHDIVNAHWYIMMSRAMRIANMETPPAAIVALVVDRTSITTLTLEEKRDYNSDSLVTPLKEVWFTLIHELVNIL